MGFTLKQARQFRNLSQEKIADMMGVHRQTYMKWEKDPDEMTIGKGKEFSRITNIEFDEIFFNTESTLSR